MREYTAGAHWCQVQLNVSTEVGASALRMRPPEPSSSCATMKESVAGQAMIVSSTDFIRRVCKLLV